MKALVLHGNKDLRYEDFPEPPLLAGEVRLRVKSSGLCHTDFNEYLNGPLYVSRTPHPKTGRCTPLVLGHEFSEEVVEVARGVTRVRKGVCGSCQFCRRGLLIHCPNAVAIGFGRDGGYAEYAVVPASCCRVLRTKISYRSAALVEPFSVALHSVRRTHVQVGSTAAIIGGGTIGLCTLQVLRTCGVVDVYVIEKSPAKCKFSENLGATEFICVENGRCRASGACTN
jgi:(R,R)-butanediol dehydrogenase/meso-butanediol dehydrogenase/diacetyl reductase